MTTTIEHIAILQKAADVEGLFTLGVPEDEYNSEAREIFTQLQALDLQQPDPATIFSVINSVWQRAFRLDESEMQMRQKELLAVAEKLSAFKDGK